MTKYKVHGVYIVAALVFLYFFTETAIKTALDPTYVVPGARYVPRALLWYLCPLFWYGFLTTAYKVEIRDNQIRVVSFLKKLNIKAEEIVSLEKRMLRTTIAHENGKINLSALIDGFSDLNARLRSLNSELAITDADIEKPKETSQDRESFRRMLIRIGLVLLAIAFGLHVELDHLTRISQHSP